MKREKHAIVIGGSMAGLLAARVLSDHFETVTIVERDRFPETATARKGVPQSHHLHVLLMRGLHIMERMFPGLRRELIDAGALEVDTGADFAWLTPAGWGVRFESGLRKIAFTRPLLDWIIRGRLLSIANIRFMEGCEIAGLIASADHTRVTGVRLNSQEQISGDLIVDASGRGSRIPRWLIELGYEAPRETVINAHLGYASRMYKRPPAFDSGWKGAFIQAAPPKHPRAGVLFSVEQNRWMVTFGGGSRQYPPTDEAGFLEFARSLPSSIIYDAIRDAEPLSPIYTYRATENRWRHYEKLRKFPEGLVLLGDAVCAFNPVYGQGMTTAALGVELLDRCLKELAINGNFSQKFQRRLARLNASPWMLATSEDYRYRGTEGGKPRFLLRVMQRYAEAVVALTTVDAEVRKQWLKVFHMLEPASTLFHPYILKRVAFSTPNSRLSDGAELSPFTC